MKKLLLSAALTGAAVTLAACSQEAAETAESDATAETDTMTDQSTETATAGVLDANTATEEQLAAIEGMTPELATAIVAGQPYANVIDLNTVMMNLVSESEAAALREKVFVAVNLNDTTSEELALIPGIDERMVHEFEEYAPYGDMTDFDREIGKYVDEAEVARFRQYVTL